MSEAVSSIMAQSWPWGSQIAVKKKKNYYWVYILNFYYFSFFFLSGFSFTDADNSQYRRGREGTFFLFHCTTSTASRTSRHLFATLHVRRLDEIYHLIELPLIDDVMLIFCSFTWLDSRFLLQIFGPILPKKGISRF